MAHARAPRWHFHSVKPLEYVQEDHEVYIFAIVGKLNKQIQMGMR
jgi:hypothetical protein